MLETQLSDGDDVSSDSGVSAEEDQVVARHGRSAREREIRAAWRATWTGRRRVLGDVKKEEWGEKPFLEYDTQFDLSPAAFVSSAPARSSDIEQQYGDVGTRPARPDPHWSPRGVEDDRREGKYAPLPSYRSRSTVDHTLRDELQAYDFNFPPELVARLDAWRQASPDAVQIRHASTWPLPLDAADLQPARVDTPPAIRAIAGFFLPSCCVSNDRSGER